MPVNVSADVHARDASESVPITRVCANVSLQLTGFGKGFVTAGAFEHFGLLRVHFGSLVVDVLVFLKGKLNTK